MSKLIENVKEPSSAAPDDIEAVMAQEFLIKHGLQPRGPSAIVALAELLAMWRAQAYAHGHDMGFDEGVCK
jgi:hypothetical protein